MKKDWIDILDGGYVRLVDKLGSDLTVANAARVSYSKESFHLTDADKRLIAFLARKDHTSPFRHAMAQFEVYAPLMVARQWWKYVVGSDHTMDGWNESSRRYITEKPTFYIPQSDKWRSAPANSKQGSGKPVNSFIGLEFTERLIAVVDHGVKNYEEAMARGICAEQARLFLPAYGMMVRWYWTSSLQGICHLINQRLGHDAQYEFQLYAKAVLELIKIHFPTVVEYMVVFDED